VYLRTDHEEYFVQMMDVFGASVAFKAVETPEELSSLPTYFERDFQTENPHASRSYTPKMRDARLV